MSAGDVISFDIRVPVTSSVPHVGRRLCCNGASIIFVTDKDSTKPAASMSIAVGSNNDPTEFPGLAHFCEHMLFMGTAKYPSEDAYDAAVTRSGGYSNAWTGSDVTTYYYTSGLDAFKSLLEMFLEFFISPSFNTSAVDREINAVHSEDEKNHSVDYWRIDELIKQFFIESHPNSRYGNGNLTTLRDWPAKNGFGSVHEALKIFFNQYYVAERSCLVIYSPFTDSDLMPLIEPILAKLRVGPRAPQRFLTTAPQVIYPSVGVSQQTNVTFSPHPWRPDCLSKWYNVINTTKKRSVTLYWVLPYGGSERNWRSMPYAYASHLLGHEVEGTVLSSLRKSGYATAVTSSVDPSHVFDEHFIPFSISVSLTEEGFCHVPDVIDIVFQYIELIRRSAVEVPVVDGEGEAQRVARLPPMASYEECRRESQTVFEFSEVGDCASYASGLSNRAAQIGAEYAVCGTEVYLDDEAGWGDDCDTIVACGDRQLSLAKIKRLEDVMRVFDLLNPQLCIVLLSAGDEDSFLKAHYEKGAFMGNVLGFKRSAEASGVPNSDSQMSKVVFEESERRVTPFHSMIYTVGEIPDVMMTAWSTPTLSKLAALDPSLSLPPPNPFLSDDFTLFQPPSQRHAPPQRIEMKYGYALVKRSEAHLMVPKVTLIVNMIIPNLASLPQFYLRVLKNMIFEATTDSTYFAQLSGINVSIDVGAAGFIFTFSGPSATTVPFALTTFEQILKVNFLKQTQEVYSRHAQRLALQIEGELEAQPLTLAKGVAGLMVTPFAWPLPTMLAYSKLAHYGGSGAGGADASNTVPFIGAVPDIDTSKVPSRVISFCEFAESILRSFRVEVFVYGNLEENITVCVGENILNRLDELFVASGANVADVDSLESYRSFYVPKVQSEETVSTDCDEHTSQHPSRLILANVPAYSKTNINAAVIVRLYAGPSTPTTEPLYEHLSLLMTSSFFNTLRTTESLGYMVGAGAGSCASRFGYFSFAVQSAVAPPLYLYSRIVAFLDAFEEQVMATLDDATIATTVKGQIEQRKMICTSVADEANTLFSDRLNPSGFDYREREVEFLESEDGITREKLIALYRRVLSNKSAERRGFVVFINSSALPEEATDCGSCTLGSCDDPAVIARLSLPLQLPIQRDFSSIAKGAKAKVSNIEESSDIDGSEDDAKKIKVGSPHDDTDQVGSADGSSDPNNSEVDAEDEQEEEEGDSGSDDNECAAVGGAVVDTKLVTNTFATPTFVRFVPVSSFGDAKALADYHFVGFL